MAAVAAEPHDLLALLEDLALLQVVQQLEIALLMGLLNLGHTIGHAVEKLMNFQLLHGQCVGIGLVAAAAISKERGLLTQEEYQQVCHALEIYNLPLYVEGLSPQDILAATKKDKKMEQGQIKFILMDGLGKSFIDKTVTDEELLVGIHAICR